MISSCLAAAPHTDNYGYEIKLDNLVPGVENRVMIPGTAMPHINQNYSNIQIADQENNSVPFKLFQKNAKKNFDFRIHEVSSKKDNSSPLFLTDNDVLTVYEFDKKADMELGYSYVIFKTDYPLSLSRVLVDTSSSSRIRTMQIEAGETLQKMEILQRRTTFERLNDVKTDKLYNWIKVSFWGQNIDIADINLFSGRQAEVYFVPDAEKDYRFLYGNPTLKSIRYNGAYGSPLLESSLAQMSSIRVNPIFKADFDQDGIDNEVDNCLFVSNKNQKDRDRDMTGDVCDNAPMTKNSDQKDIDVDGVGDIVDNCPLVSNADQKNKDKDQFGDACDTGHGSEISTRDKEIYLAIGIGISLLIGLVAVWYVGRKKI